MRSDHSQCMPCVSALRCSYFELGASNTRKRKDHISSVYVFSSKSYRFLSMNAHNIQLCAHFFYLFVYQAIAKNAPFTWIYFNFCTSINGCSTQNRSICMKFIDINCNCRSRLRFVQLRTGRCRFFMQLQKLVRISSRRYIRFDWFLMCHGYVDRISRIMNEFIITQ